MTTITVSNKAPKDFGLLPIPQHLRYDPDKPIHFGLLMNIAFGLFSTFSTSPSITKGSTIKLMILVLQPHRICIIASLYSVRLLHDSLRKKCVKLICDFQFNLQNRSESHTMMYRGQFQLLRLGRFPDMSEIEYLHSSRQGMSL